MSPLADRIRSAACPVALGAVAAVAALAAGAAGGARASQPASGDAVTMTVVDQTFSVTAGETMRIDVELAAPAADLAELLVPATTTTTSPPTSPPPPTPAPTSTAAPAPTATPAATATPAPTTAGAAAPGSPTTVADAAGFIGRSGPPPAAGSDGSIVVTLHEPITGAAELSTLDSEGPGDALGSVTIALAEVAEGGDPDSETVTVELSVPIELGGDDPAALHADGGGIHPVSLELRTGSDTITAATTFVLVNDPADASAADPYPIAILATIDDPGPWAESDEIAAAQGELARLVELAAATDATLTLNIPPSVARPTVAPPDVASSAATDVSAVPETAGPGVSDASAAMTGATATSGGGSAALDGSAPAADGERDAGGLLADQVVGDELLGRPLVPLDPSSLAGIGQVDLLTEQLRRGEEALAAAGPQALRGRTVWVSTQAITRDGADALRDLGVQMVVVPPAVADAMGIDDDVFAIDLGGGATLPGLVTSPLGEQLVAPDDGGSASDAAIRLLVEAILHRDEGQSPGLVLATGASGVPDPAVTAAFVRHAEATPGVTVVGASKLTGAVGAAGRDTTVTASDAPAVDLTQRAAAIEALRPSADAAASMLVDPAPASRWDDDFVRVLATTIDDNEASERLAETGAEIDGYVGAVVPPDPFTFDIIGTSSYLPLRIVNNSDQALDVVVRVASPKLETEDLATTLVPGENSVRVPVTARSNGTFSVEVSILTPTDTELARPVVLKADVTRLSGVSRVVTIGALLALASWWYSHFRKRRRLQRAGSEPAMRLEPGPVLSPDAAESRDPG